MIQNNLQEIKKALSILSNPKQAKILSRFFKAGKGEYGEGDIFLGIKVGLTRKVAKKYVNRINLTEIEELLYSKIHEERLCALLIMVDKYENKKTNAKERKKIYKVYLSNTKWINNWDLVDLSSHHIVGEYIYSHPKEKPTLIKLANSKLLWNKRISMISCYYFIYRKQYSEAIEIAKILLNDTHDLMHKAVGWMLREIGKRDLETEEKFLRVHYKEMPRTMLRYAIEKFPEEKRKKYLKGKIWRIQQSHSKLKKIN